MSRGGPTTAFGGLVIFLLVLPFLAATPRATEAQCVLSNPSFEITGSGGTVFGGWNQFGSVGSTNQAVHGSLAARVSGPNTGQWGVSGFWQAMDCAPGEIWQAAGQVLVSASQPLVGGNTALVNVEWRDSGGNLISYDSFPVANAASMTDTWLPFAEASSPAPAGTVTARILVGTLQGPSEPVSEAVFDAITFASTTSPTVDEIQWDDFPGGRALDFAGRQWRVKGPGIFGPGPNVFADGPEAVWTDAQGSLHLTQAWRDGAWESTEVVLEEALGYGDYIVTTVGDLGALDPSLVLGFFLWQYGPCWDPSFLWWNPYNEIDIEYSRWNDPVRDLGQFVAQPYDWPGNLSRFAVSFTEGDTISSAMRWLPHRVEYRVWRGGPGDESADATLAAWTYTGPHIPRPEQPRLHLNLWRLDPEVPDSHQEVVISNFQFVKDGALSGVPDDDAGNQPHGSFLRFRGASPNPFNPRTTLHFTLKRGGVTHLSINTLEGRRIRTLYDGNMAAGDHSMMFDGRDEDGRPVASGVYFARLVGRGFAESQKLVLVR